MKHFRRHTLLTLISLVLGIMLVWWISPNTDSGATLLIVCSTLLVNGIGAISWRYSKTRSNVWLGWLAILAFSLSQTACGYKEPYGSVNGPIGILLDNAFYQCMLSKGNPVVGIWGPSKDPGAFAADQEVCRNYASSQLQTQAERANANAVGGAVLGTVLGAGLGAAVGGGRGASIGAASGAVVGGGGFDPAVHAPLRPVRAFLSAGSIPPPGVGAYGVVALRTLPTPANSDRLLMMCRAFLASLPAKEALPSDVALKDQMITFWPLNSRNSSETQLAQCDYLTKNYDLYGGVSAIEDAEGQDHPLSGRGPFLIGWSPSNMRRHADAVVLVVDMSDLDSQASFDDTFSFWQNKIVEDPSLWRKGFSLEHLRLAIRDFSDHYGQSILSALKFWRNG